MVSLRIKNHLKVDCSIGIRQTIQSDQESHSLSGPETTVEDQEGIDTDTVVFPKNDQNNQLCCSDLLKDIPNWSQTGKRGREKTVAENTDDKIYNVMPLSVYYGYGPEVPHTQRRLEGLLMSSSDQSLFARKKQKTDESEYIDADSYKIDSQSALELLGNMSKITTGRMNPKRAKAVKSEHRCEICGKTFQSGQALGGHKTYHRVKPVVDPFRGEFVQRIPKKQLSLSGRDNHVQVRDFMTSMLLPMGLSGKAGSISEESYQQHPKRLLDFDLNIPYVG